MEHLTVTSELHYFMWNAVSFPISQMDFNTRTTYYFGEIIVHHIISCVGGVLHLFSVAFGIWLIAEPWTTCLTFIWFSMRAFIPSQTLRKHHVDDVILKPRSDWNLWKKMQLPKSPKKKLPFGFCNWLTNRWNGPFFFFFCLKLLVQLV